MNKDIIAVLNILIKVCSILGKIGLILYAYKYIYFVIGLFTTRKFPKTDHRFKYAVVVAARNESAVIGQLITSIKRQDYPQELLTIFVVADNCTDNTADIARSLGAVCYERFDRKRCTKGFALEFLFDCISLDYGIDTFDGYFIFDADNLLKADYITRMNESFAAGEKIITSYRNTKNFGENWISASYGIHWLRTIRSEHRARSVLKLATRIQGTGVLISNEIVQDGWHYTSLTEDRALSADSVVNGYRISYNNAAEFYDEQPTSLRIAMRQRIRWSKGHIQAFFESGPKLFINSLKKHSFMSWDMLMTIFPRLLVSSIRKLLSLTASIFLMIFGASAAGGSLGILVGVGLNWGKFYIRKIFEAAYVFIAERKRIPYIPLYKIVLYCLTWPSFDFIGRVAMCIAAVSKVEWKPIPHKCGIQIDDIHNIPADNSPLFEKTAQKRT